MGNQNSPRQINIRLNLPQLRNKGTIILLTLPVIIISYFLLGLSGLIILSPLVLLIVSIMIGGYKDSGHGANRTLNFLKVAVPISLVLGVILTNLLGIICTADGGPRCKPELHVSLIAGLILLIVWIIFVYIGKLIKYLLRSIKHSN